MTQKAKPEFADYGIIFTKAGDNVESLLAKAHSGAWHFVGDIYTLTAAKHLLPSGATILKFPYPPKADDETVEFIRGSTKEADVLIAVGSGTLNDLCKYASFLDNKPYSIIATAPSMNGYVSANASITVGGYKQTLSAHAPMRVICDQKILKNAPSELIAAGVGDVLCRSTIQADWLLSHLLIDTPYEPAYFDWFASEEIALLENSNNTDTLTRALLLSGLAMRDHGSSTPASQGEHMIVHFMEMLYPQLPTVYHGHAIAVTTLTMAKWQERFLYSETPPLIFPPDFRALPETFREEARAQYTRKWTPENLKKANHRLQHEWNEIREKIQAVTLPSDILEGALRAAGCPTTHAEIGWPDAWYRKAVSHAHLTRDRVTFLDLG